RAGAVMAARAQVHGLVVHDHQDLAPEHAQRVGDLLAAGELVTVEDRYPGLDLAPTAFARLMSGRNTGKVLVDVS
ncbi:zinc-binding dehydrogenase, partial [Nocardioides hankookensis]